MGDNTQHRWNHEKLLTVFTGLLVLVGLIYSLTSAFQWLSMREQARVMAQQMEVMRAEIEDCEADSVCRSHAQI